MQQPGQRRGGGLVDRAPSQITAAASAGQRYIQKTQTLGQFFPAGTGQVLFKVLGTEIDGGLVAGSAVMVDKLLAVSHAQAATPGKRQKNHRVLQSLAAVHRNDPNSILVTFKAHQ